MRHARSTKVLTLGAGAVAAAVALGMAPQATKSSSTSPDYAKLANTLVNTCAGLKAEEVVLIEGGARDIELLENLAVECRKIGAQPFILLGSDRLDRMMYTEVPAEYDTQKPKFAKKLAEMVEATITIDYHERPGLLADIDPQRIMARQKTMQPVMKEMMDKNVVSVHLGNDLYPTRARAERFGISQQDLAKIFWDGVNVDYNQLQTIGSIVQGKLVRGKELRITAANGTDVTVEINNRPTYVSDGVVSYDDRTSGGPSCQVWLPAGEVYLTPEPGKATGTFVADHFDFEGKSIEGLTLKFERGKLTSMTAKGDISALKRKYEAAPEGKELFSAINFGINPNVVTPPNSKFTSWVAAGTVSIGFGNNLWAGGNNDVPFEFFARLPNATVTIDGVKFIDQGKLITN